MKISCASRKEYPFCGQLFVQFYCLTQMTEQASPSSHRTITDLTSKDLLGLKKQVLKQAYDKEISVKQQKGLMPNPETETVSGSESRLYPSRSLQLLPSYSQANKQASKQLLKQSYEAEIRNKLLRKQQEKAKLNSEADVLSELTKYQSEYQLKQKKVKEDYARFLEEEIARKQQQKVQQRQQEHQEEQIRANRKNGLLNKEHSFKHFYSSLDQHRNNINSEYLNYVHETRVREQEKTNHERQLLERQRKMIEQQANEEKRRHLERRQELRKVLEQQIMQNRSYKATELKEFKNRGYVPTFNNAYNPISNPIDYQLDLNNKYLLRQLMEKQQYGQHNDRTAP